MLQLASKSKADLSTDNKALRAELQLLKRARKAESFVAILLALIRAAVFIAAFHYSYLIVASLAGKNTVAEFVLKFLGIDEVSKPLSWLVGVLGIAYGKWQHKIRRDTIERLQGRIKALESMFDPKRSSSNLTQRGETRVEDTL